MKPEKFTCIEQLFDEEICFDPKVLLLSLESYLGKREIIEALEYISRVEDWQYRITEDGNITKQESED